MKEIEVTGKVRTDLGKKASKLLRKEGLIPCNIYGEKKDENGAPVAFSFVSPMSELRKIVYTPHRQGGAPHSRRSHCRDEGTPVPSGD